MKDDFISRSALLEAVENIDWHSVNSQGVLHEGAKDEESAFLRYSEVVAAIETAPVAQADLSHIKPLEGEHCIGPHRMDQILDDMVCPFCENVSGFEKKQRTSRALFAKGEAVSYEEHYIHCPGCGADFTPGKMMDENLARAREARKASKKEG